MADSSSSSKTISLKLLIYTQANKVLFAEAGKDFVDFLFSVLSLPVADIVGLVRKHGMVGSLQNLYESVENLNESYVQSPQAKSTLLTPPKMSTDTGVVPLLAINAAAQRRRFYKCTNSSNSNACVKHVSDDPRAVCPNCKRTMTIELNYVSPLAPPELHVSGEGGGGGFVKGVVTYMVMDDLVVTPMSTISSITMLNKFNISNVGALEERVVNFGVNEATKLLKTSLEAKNVLTRVFLK